ncbi:MAG: ATP-binding protein [Opitutae bacterium]|nr:ATP-binding protein [Opitutae bacterium]
MYTRNIYLNKIRPFLGKPVIKVITGMRRVGKSCLLRQVIDLLQEDGVSPERILRIDKESLDFEHIKTYDDLNRTALAAFSGKEAPCYLVVDEVQEIEEWERAIISLAARGDIDILISGSNAHLLSSELATLISGRYIEIPVYSLGFAEHLQFSEQNRTRRQEEFSNFLRMGGMPATYHFERDEELIHQYIGSVYNTILLKDIVKRHAIRNVSLLENIARYLFDNIGNTMSAKRIADYLKAQRLRVGVDTVQNYLGYFTEALLAHKVLRYDMKGKRHLELHEKYYLNDIGIRHALLGYREADIGGILENIVFLELKRRGYSVSIGKLGDREVDFIATRQNEKIYIQVAYLLASPETIEREFGVLKSIPDNYPKYVLSLDTLFGENFDGIQRINLIDFLLSEI